MGALYITGGQQRSYVETDEWRQYGRGLIVRVDSDSGEGSVCASYVSPPEVCPDTEPSISFKSGSLVGNRLYVCTSTEVLVYDVPSFEVVQYISLPAFNDLHHVRPRCSGTLLLANTGLDMVIEITPEGEVVREWNVLGREPWAHFSPHVDYRKVPTTKPHKAHPNHVFVIDGKVWVTRFNQRDAVCLNGDDGRHAIDDDRLAIDVQRPHDGSPHGDFVYFTTVDGHVVVVNAKTRQTEDIIDLNEPDGQGTALGWCRGLGLLTPTLAWIGFSRFRPTKFMENVSWIKSGFRRRRKPTHIALYDLARRERVREIELESLGLHTVFSVISGPEAAAEGGA
ncbi:MAG: hypothetical protein R2712_18085 [Vicinamibacterales bacterium]